MGVGWAAPPHHAANCPRLRPVHAPGREGARSIAAQSQVGEACQRCQEGVVRVAVHAQLQLLHGRAQLRGQRQQLGRPLLARPVAQRQRELAHRPHLPVRRQRHGDLLLLARQVDHVLLGLPAQPRHQLRGALQGAQVDCQLRQVPGRARLAGAVPGLARERGCKPAGVDGRGRVVGWAFGRRSCARLPISTHLSRSPRWDIMVASTSSGMPAQDTAVALRARACRRHGGARRKRDGGGRQAGMPHGRPQFPATYLTMMVALLKAGCVPVHGESPANSGPRPELAGGSRRPQMPIGECEGASKGWRCQGRPVFLCAVHASWTCCL